ncbi:MAG: diadenosine tetraphosphate hydrolase [Leptospiraceae bacterium]|nr:diadenosine tetraphosphate hydrolase [Leptospiraceae bacterium]
MSEDSPSASPFLAAPRIAENQLSFAIRDRFPVSTGHSLIVSKRVVSRYDELDSAEKQSMWALVDLVVEDLKSKLGATDFNFGINMGPAAGQTVWHVHIHVIPRNSGDVQDPEGGVRGVISHKQKY